MMSFALKDTKRMQIPNKQLQPIYDALDTFNYSKAIRMIQKLFKQYPESHLLMGLHAVALSRTNRAEEALLLARKVTQDQPIDPVVLHTLYVTFRDSAQYHDIVSMFETAHRVCPEFQDFADQYFSSLIFTKDFQQMQKLSVRLSKTYPKDSKYFYFNLLSTFLQAVSIDDFQKSKVLFTLCKKMMYRALNEKKVKDVEELLFFVDLLEMQQYDDINSSEKKDAIKSLVAILPELVKNRSMLRQLQLTWMDLKEDVVSLAEQMLKENNDDWDAWKALLRFAPTTLEKWTDYVNHQIPSQDTRVYFLVQLEYTKLQKLNPPQTLVLEFWNHWGHTPSFYHDLSSFFLCTLCEYWQTVLKTIPMIKSIDSIDSLIRCVHLLKLHYVHGLLEKDQATVNSILALYNEALILEQDLLPTDPHYAERLLILAVYVLVNLSFPETLYVASVLLENGLLVSPYSAALKLTLIWVYQQLGVATRGLALYKSLDIKYLQWHTLGYIYSDYLMDLGYFSQATPFLKQCQSIYLPSEKECNEMINLAFDNKAYSKIPEFHRFYTQLTHSFSPKALHLQWQRLHFDSMSNSTIVSPKEPGSFQNDRDYTSWLDVSGWLPVSDLSKNSQFSMYRLFFQFLFNPTNSSLLDELTQLNASIRPFPTLAKGLSELYSHGSLNVILEVLEHEQCHECDHLHFLQVKPLLQHAKLTEMVTFIMVFIKQHQLKITPTFRSLHQWIESFILHLSKFQSFITLFNPSNAFNQSQFFSLSCLNEPPSWSDQLQFDWSEQCQSLVDRLQLHQTYLASNLNF